MRTRIRCMMTRVGLTRTRNYLIDRGILPEIPCHPLPRSNRQEHLEKIRGFDNEDALNIEARTQIFRDEQADMDDWIAQG